MEGKLTARIDELAGENSQQYEEIVHMKRQILNLESLLPSKFSSNDAAIPSSYKNGGPSTRILSGPPNSCQELKDNNIITPMNGIHLLKNKDTKKIEAFFCVFPTINNPIPNVVQEIVGTVEVKTKSFYVQKSSYFGTANAVIPFEFARLNQGDAFHLRPGIFTVPVSGIYHFDFSGVKSSSATFVTIYLQVNGTNVGYGYTSQTSTGEYHTVSLSASLRLAAGDRVNLFNNAGGVLYDYYNHMTHFTGWLVEEDLM